MIIIFINIIMIISMNKTILCLMVWLKKVERLSYDNYHDDLSLFRQTIEAWIMFI